MAKNDDDENDAPSIVSDFDKICFEFGDQDAIVLEDDDTPISYFEIQEYSKVLACQLHFRLNPNYVLVDCQGWPAAEAVATLACMRLNCPFVPVSCLDQHRPGRMKKVVDLLKQHSEFIVAVTVCENDRDPILSVFQGAGVHSILYLDKTGMLREQLQVPTSLPGTIPHSDDVYILFTSGTSSATPKAVVGSHEATRNRLHWFLNKFPSSPRIGRRTKLTFVDGVTELWCALLDPSVVLIAVNPTKLQQEGIQLFLQLECTQLLLLPSQLVQLLLLPTSPTLERVIVSGEPCSAALLKNFQSKYANTELINLYGQTETTGDVLCADLVRLGEQAIVDNVVAVGSPIGDTQITLNDGTNELIVSGSQLSNGYLGQSKFQGVFTGDIGFSRNKIWYVQGRRDDIVKRNGIWTSPIEIEAAFAKTYCDDESEVAAVVIEDQTYVVVGSSPSICDKFSREYMYQSGIPWNLIPDKVISTNCIPRSKIGAGKVDRKACKQIVLEVLEGSKKDSNSKNDHGENKATKPDFLSIVSRALGGTNQLDPTQSFVDLGGDSAKSITLLYLLRQDIESASALTATDILLSDSLHDISSMLKGDSPKSKRRKVEELVEAEFVPQEIVQCSSIHKAMGLKACVDSTPLVFGESIYAACQGGVIVKLSLDGSMEGFRHLCGWMIQADLLYTGNSIIVCSYSLSGKGRALSLSLDLQNLIWTSEFDGPIKSTPLLDKKKLWFVVGDSVSALNVDTGLGLGIRTKLPHRSVARPLMCRKHGEDVLVHVSSDWEAGLMLVDQQGNVSCHLEDEIGPVHNDLTTIGETHIVLVDSYGSVHCADLESMKVTTTQVSSVPLSSPLVADGRIVVGDLAGKISCLNMSLETQWAYTCGKAIFTKPVALPDGSILFCTTAGHIMKICPKSNEIEWHHRIPAEIWSDPVSIGSCVAFGARDSQFHVIAIPTKTKK